MKTWTGYAEINPNELQAYGGLSNIDLIKHLLFKDLLFKIMSSDDVEYTCQEARYSQIHQVELHIFTPEDYRILKDMKYYLDMIEMYVNRIKDRDTTDINFEISKLRNSIEILTEIK